MADATGTTVWRWDQQEPFGANPANDDPDGNSVAFDLPLRLPGQRYDQESGLHYNYFRDYDPSLGIYKQSDPIGLNGGLNTYAYVIGRPIQAIDMYGLNMLTPPDENQAREALCKECESRHLDCILMANSPVTRRVVGRGCRPVCSGMCIALHFNAPQNIPACFKDCVRTCKEIPDDICEEVRIRCRKEYCKPDPNNECHKDQYQ